MWHKKLCRSVRQRQVGDVDVFHMATFATVAFEAQQAVCLRQQEHAAETSRASGLLQSYWWYHV